MGVDHSKSLLRITFQGLFIICQNERAKQWEIGVPCVPDHTFSCSLRKIDGSIRPGREKMPNPRGNRNIYILPDPEVDTSAFSASGFNRKNDKGDVNDFRWLIDMEGGEFHGGKLKLRTPLPNPPCPAGVTYKTKIFVKGGELYTDLKTIERYKRIKDGNARDRRELGKLAITVGINLPREDARSITIKNDGGVTNTLKPELGVRYELSFTHMPQEPAGTVKVTHFKHYYMVLKDDDDTQFNVLEVSQPDTTPAPDMGHTHGEPASGQTHKHVQPSGSGDDDDPSGGTEPQVCNGIFLGKSKSGLP